MSDQKYIKRIVHAKLKISHGIDAYVVQDFNIKNNRQKKHSVSL